MKNQSLNLKTGHAFAPGHITGFFQICDEARQTSMKGSKGAGICLAKGVSTTVEAIPITSSSSETIGEPEIYINGNRTINAITTNKTVQYILEKIENEGLIDLNFRLIIKSKIELPIGQGFGLSGAGALSTALAINDALDLAIPLPELTALAHRAEVELKSGLGDVGAQTAGGVPIRLKPGIPPHGEIIQLISNSDESNFENIEILLCVIGPVLDTNNILTSEKNRNIINKYGDISLKILLKTPNLENLFKISYQFALGTQLVSPEVFNVLELVHSKNGLASMSMLGNSIFILDTKKTTNFANILKKYGNVYRSKIDIEGARILTN